MNPLIGKFCLFVCLLAASASAMAAAVPLSYSGRLTNTTGRPVSGAVTLRAEFFRDHEGGSPLAVTLADMPTTLADGMFHVSLALSDADFHLVFNGIDQAWIQITDVTHDKVYPRQTFSIIPYALKVPVDGDVFKYDTNGKLTLKVDLVPDRVLGTDLGGDLTWIDLSGSGTGDMLSGTWDSNSNSKVDQADMAANAANAADAALLSGQPASHYLSAANLTTDATHRLVTDAEKTAWNGVVAWGNHNGAGYLTGASPLDATKLTGEINDARIPAGIARDGELAAAARASVSGTGPVAYNGTTGVFSMSAANGTTNGYLASGDWTTFNGKQPLIGTTTDVTLDQLIAKGDIRLDDDDASHNVTIKANDTTTGSYTLTLPAAPGNNLDVLQTNASGVLTWIPIPSAPVTTVNTQSGNVVLDTDDVLEGANKYFSNTLARGALSGTAPVTYNSGTGAIGIVAATTAVPGSMSAADKTKIDAIEPGADVTDATNVAAAGALMDGDFTANGIMTRTNAGAYAVITDGSADWNTAHTDRLKWDGGPTGLVVATAKTSLGYGTMADQNANAVAITGGTISGTTLSSFASTGIDDNATSTAVTIDSNEFVGIGGSPTSILTVVRDDATTTSGANAHVAIANYDTTDDNQALMSFRTADTASTQIVAARIGAVFPSHGVGTTTGALTFSTAPSSAALTERVRINSAGNVGIGTTTPGYRLHVHTSGGSAIYGSSMSSTGVAYGVFGNTNSSPGSTSYGVFGRSMGNSDVNIGGYFTAINGDVNYALITGTGNVGIGTDTPTAKLHVNGTAGVDGIKFPDGTLQTTAAPTSGRVIQRVYATSATWSSMTAQIPTDDTIPQITEGTQVMTATITPTSATNRLRIVSLVPFTMSGLGTSSLALFQDASANALAANFVSVPNTFYLMQISVSHDMVAGTTGATTFRLRMGPNAAQTTYINGGTAGRIFGGVMSSSLAIEEYVP